MAKLKSLTEEEVAERSLLMRIYHCRIVGDAFYHSNFVTDVVLQLETKGWIERHGDGWRMTENGVTAWADMNRELLNSANYHVSGIWNELKLRAGGAV